MKKSEWSDKQLEEILRQMPKIQDHRHPRDIYQNLSIKKRKYPTWVLPGVATVAALLLFIILVPKLMVGTQYSMDKAQKESSVEQKANRAEDRSSLSMKKQESTVNNEGISGSEAELFTEKNVKTALYDNEIGDQQVLTYWIPDPQAQILIPVSTMVNIDEDKTWLELFNESMGQITEEEWGLSNYYPLNATIELDTSDNSVIVNVPADHKYGQGSAMETNFIGALKKDIASNSNVKKIKLKTNSQPGIEFGNIGLLTELDIESEQNHAYFFYNPDGKDVPFLVPSTGTYQNINEALAAMKSDQSQFGLKASLHSTIQYQDVVIKDKTLYVTLLGDSPMKDDLMTLYSFEALLLTAKDFGLENIAIINTPIKQLGPFDLTKETKVPIAANFRPIQ